VVIVPCPVQAFSAAMASCQACWSRAEPGPASSAKRIRPERSIRKVPRLAKPAASLKTSYRWATSPCGQKSASSGNSKPSCSDQILWL